MGFHCLTILSWGGAKLAICTSETLLGIFLAVPVEPFLDIIDTILVLKGIRIALPESADLVRHPVVFRRFQRQFEFLSTLT